MLAAGQSVLPLGVLAGPHTSGLLFQLHNLAELALVGDGQGFGSMILEQSNSEASTACDWLVTARRACDWTAGGESIDHTDTEGEGGRGLRRRPDGGKQGFIFRKLEANGGWDEEEDEEDE